MREAMSTLHQALRLVAADRLFFLSVSGLLLVPLLAVKLVARAIAAAPAAGPEPLRALGAGVVEVAELAVLVVTYGALVLAVADRTSGGRRSVSELWSLVLGRARPLLTSALAFMGLLVGWGVLGLLAAGAGAALLAPLGLGFEDVIGVTVPLLIGVLAVRFAFVAHVAALEREGGFAACRRARALLGGRVRATIGVLAPFFALRFGLEPLVEGAFGEATGEVVHLVGSVVAEPIEAAALLLLYVGARRAEAGAGYDEDHLRAEVAGRDDAAAGQIAPPPRP